MLDCSVVASAGTATPTQITSESVCVHIPYADIKLHYLHSHTRTRTHTTPHTHTHTHHPHLPAPKHTVSLSSRSPLPLASVLLNTAAPTVAAKATLSKTTAAAAATAAGAVAAAAAAVCLAPTLCSSALLTLTTWAVNVTLLLRLSLLQLTLHPIAWGPQTQWNDCIKATLRASMSAHTHMPVAVHFIDLSHAFVFGYAVTVFIDSFDSWRISTALNTI